eukprot:6559273-Heterocapsa_arctica.AAC.1
MAMPVWGGKSVGWFGSALHEAPMCRLWCTGQGTSESHSHASNCRHLGSCQSRWHHHRQATSTTSFV